jgi:hypothetical protein
MLIRILGKQWNLKFLSNLGQDKDGTKYWGFCDDPKVPNPQIRILKKLPPKEELSTTQHELLHAAAYDLLSEEWVDQTSQDIGEILWKLGYRKLTKEQRKQLGID